MQIAHFSWAGLCCLALFSVPIQAQQATFGDMEVALQQPPEATLPPVVVEPTPQPEYQNYGGYGSGASFVDGLTPAIWVGAVVVGLGAVAALFIPRRRPAEVEALRPVLEEAA